MVFLMEGKLGCLHLVVCCLPLSVTALEFDGSGFALLYLGEVVNDAAKP